jgi:hypothetical protein
VIERLSRPGLQRTALWASALVLIAGVVAFATVRIGGSDDSTPAAAPTNTVGDGTDFDPGPSSTPAKESDVPKEAREVAGEFILAAAGREDLERGWELAHPDLKRDCACTKQEWLTGNINVQYFPTAGLQGASFSVDEASPDRVVLQVLLTPKKGSGVQPTAFYIGLKKLDGKWLVDYWAPNVAIPVPQTG